MPACPLSCSPRALISRCFIAKQAATTDKQTDGTGIQPAPRQTSDQTAAQSFAAIIK